MGIDHVYRSQNSIGLGFKSRTRGIGSSSRWLHVARWHFMARPIHGSAAATTFPARRLSHRCRRTAGGVDCPCQPTTSKDARSEDPTSEPKPLRPIPYAASCFKTYTPNIYKTTATPQHQRKQR